MSRKGAHMSTQHTFDAVTPLTHALDSIWGRKAAEQVIMLTHLFCGENRKTDQSSLVSHQSGLYASSIFSMRKHKLCNKHNHETHTDTDTHEEDTHRPAQRNILFGLYLNYIHE